MERCAVFSRQSRPSSRERARARKRACCTAGLPVQPRNRRADPREPAQAQAVQDVKKVRTDPELSSRVAAVATRADGGVGAGSGALGIGFGSGWPSSSSDIASA